jgi:hypothetical protein
MAWTNTTGKMLFLNADKSKVVEEGPDAAWVLVGPDGEVSDEDAERYGLTKAAEKAADKAVEKPADKAAPKKPA